MMKPMFLPKEKPNFIINYFNARSSGNKLDLHIDSWIPLSRKKNSYDAICFFT